MQIFLFPWWECRFFFSSCPPNKKRFPIPVSPVRPISPELSCLWCAVGDSFHLFEWLLVDKCLLGSSPPWTWTLCYTASIHCVCITGGLGTQPGGSAAPRWARGWDSTLLLGTAVGLSWKHCSGRMWKVILLLFRMLLLVIKQPLRCCSGPLCVCVCIYIFLFWKRKKGELKKKKREKRKALHCPASSVFPDCNLQNWITFQYSGESI